MHLSHFSCCRNFDAFNVITFFVCTFLSTIPSRTHEYYCNYRFQYSTVRSTHIARYVIFFNRYSRGKINQSILTEGRQMVKQKIRLWPLNFSNVQRTKTTPKSSNIPGDETEGFRSWSRNKIAVIEDKKKITYHNWKSRVDCVFCGDNKGLIHREFEEREKTVNSAGYYTQVLNRSQRIREGR